MLPGQMDLLSWQPPRSRRKDPATSHQAAEKSRKSAGKRHRRILEVLRAAGVPLNSEQIADRIPGSDHVKIARRTSEMIGKTIVVFDSEYINRSGSKARRYVVIP